MSNSPYQEAAGRRSITPSVMYAKDDKQERQNKHGRTEMSPWYQEQAQPRRRSPPCCVTQKCKDICAAAAQAPNHEQGDNSPVRTPIAEHNVDFVWEQANKSSQAGLGVPGEEACGRGF